MFALKKSAFIFSYLHTSQVCYRNIGGGNHFLCFDRVQVMHTYNDMVKENGHFKFKNFHYCSYKDIWYLLTSS